MADHLDDVLRRSARGFTGGPAAGPGEPPVGGLDEVRARSARRRRTRRSLRSAVVVALALAGVVGLVRVPGREPGGLRTGGESPGGGETTASAVPDGTAPTESTTPPGSDPTPTTTALPGQDVTSTTVTGRSPSGPGPAVAPTSAPRAPVGGPVALRPDGLGAAAFGQDYESALAGLTAALGAPDDPGVVGSGYGSCGVIGNRDVRWGDLTVSFTDKGSGLRLGGFYWGNSIANRNVRGGHPAPVGPGTPLLGNPWGLQLATPVPSGDALVTQVRRDYGDAQFLDLRPQGIADPTVNLSTSGRVINIVLHPVADGFAVEAIWAFTRGEAPPC